MNDQIERDQVTTLTADIVSAYVSNNPLPAKDLADLIGSIHASLAGLLAGGVEESAEPQQPAVPVKKSVHDDHVVCLEDGKRFKALKRHLITHHNLTPDEYRQKWGLPSSYPMVAPNYAAQRSALAKSLGLGRKKAEPAPAKRGGKKATAGT